MIYILFQDDMSQNQNNYEVGPSQQYVCCYNRQIFNFDIYKILIEFSNKYNLAGHQQPSENNKATRTHHMWNR